MKMDEKYLEEIRNQEQILKEMSKQNDELSESAEVEENKTQHTDTPEIDLDEIIASLGEPKVKPPNGQSTLFGGGQ